jgi:hypothetical protein
MQVDLVVDLFELFCEPVKPMLGFGSLLANPTRKPVHPGTVMICSYDTSSATHSNVLINVHVQKLEALMAIGPHLNDIEAHTFSYCNEAS